MIALERDPICRRRAESGIGIVLQEAARGPSRRIAAWERRLFMAEL
jgi:hypothetical protein